MIAGGFVIKVHGKAHIGRSIAIFAGYSFIIKSRTASEYLPYETKILCHQSIHTFDQLESSFYSKYHSFVLQC